MMKPYFVIVGLLSLAASSTSQVVINEVMASNQSTLTDEVGEFDDWIEIYNPGPGSFNLQGCYLSDDPNDVDKWPAPIGFSETIIPAGEYLIIWADNQPEQGLLHANFKLVSDGEPVILTGPSLELIDMVSLPAQEGDISYGRQTDGATQWVYFNNTTPNASNGEIVQPDHILIINEVLSTNTSDIFDDLYEFEAWVEFYNPNDFDVNLAGYTISNGSVSYTIPNTNPSFSVISGGNFQVVYCDGEPLEGPNHVSFELSATGGNLTLSGPSGALIPQSAQNAYAYPALPANVSYGRQADGGTTSINFNFPTSRESNTLIIIQPEEIYINELLTSNLSGITNELGFFEDWFELYNPNNFPVDLSGYYITDNLYNPKKWEVPSLDPDAVTLPAGGWLLFWADGEDLVGPRHATFKISSVAEELTVRSPDGFSVADHVHWQNLKADTSYGRLTDGNQPWVHFIELTPDASNNGALVTIDEVMQPTVLAFPNPVEGMLMLTASMDVLVYDPNGRRISSLRNVSEVDFSGFAPGIYMLSNKQGFIARIIKE